MSEIFCACFEHKALDDFRCFRTMVFDVSVTGDSGWRKLSFSRLHIKRMPWILPWGFLPRIRFTMNQGIHIDFGKTRLWPAMAGIALVGVAALLAGGCCTEKQSTVKMVPNEAGQPSLVLSGDVIEVTQWVETKTGRGGGREFDGQPVVPTDLIVARDFATPDRAPSWSHALNQSHEAVTLLKEGHENSAYAGSGNRSSIGQPLIDFGNSAW